MQAAVVAESGEEPSKVGNARQVEKASDEDSGVAQQQQPQAAPWWRL